MQSPELSSALDIRDAPLGTPPLELWPAEGECVADGQRVHLSRRKAGLLAVLITAPDRVVVRGRLYELVWGHAMPRRGRDVDVYVRKLRIKVAEAAPEWTFIHTHYQVGYRLAPERKTGARDVHE